MAKRVAFYVRVSTDGQTVENQLGELHAVAGRHGWQVTKIYADKGISGTKGREGRPEFDKLLKAIARREIDMVAAWSVEQEQLAGRDGEEKFADVFTQKARIVVILYRAAWGATPWTRIEMTAIKNRAFDYGYDFTLWVPLDTESRLPDYVPKTRLYADLTTFGESAVAGVIVALATERGAAVTVETLQQKTERAARAAAYEQRRAVFHGPGDGVQRARMRALTLILKLKEWAEQSVAPLVFEVHKTATNGILIIHKDDVRRRAISLAVAWRQAITNSTDQSGFEYQIFNGVPNIVPGRISIDDSQRLLSKKYYCDLAPSDEIVWTKSVQGPDPLSDDQLMER